MMQDLPSNIVLCLVYGVGGVGGLVVALALLRGEGASFWLRLAIAVPIAFVSCAFLLAGIMISVAVIRSLAG